MASDAAGDRRRPPRLDAATFEVFIAMLVVLVARLNAERVGTESRMVA
jgi:hypothetical protein